MDNTYNGSLTREQFLFYEGRIVASLVLQGLDPDEIVERINKENLFQFPTEREIARIARACLQRVDALGSGTLVRLLAEAPAAVAKQVNMYAIMKYNRIVWDFMTTVIGEKYRTQEFAFSKKELNVFFFMLQEQNDKVASWSESTINKIKQVLMKCLVECGYLDSVRAEHLNNVAIEPDLEDEIKANGDMAALPAFNCFS